MIFRKGYLIFTLALLSLFLLVNNQANINIESQEHTVKADTLGEAMTTYLPAVLNRYTNIVSPIGVQMYDSTAPSSKYHNGLVESGTTWVRIQINWSNIEPSRTSPPTYYWGSAETAFAAVLPENGGLNILGTFRYSPGWGAPAPEEPIYPDRYDEFAEFVAATVERYDGDGFNDAPGSPVITYWELFNEPDRFNFWGYKGKEFSDLLKVVYPAVKAANPGAQLVFPGIAYDFFQDTSGGPFVRSFLTDVLDNGGGNYFDVMNFHSYPVFYTNWTNNKGPGLLEKGEYIQDILAGYGLDKPIVVTETGWHSNNAASTIPGSPEIQSKYVIQLITQGYALDAKILIWWMYYDVGGGYQFDNGLVTNGTPPVEKQAYYIFQDAAETFRTARFVRKFTTGETGKLELEAYEFEDVVQNQQFFVAWLNPVTATGTEPLRIPAAQVLVRNPIAGSQYSVTDGQDGIVDGYVTVQVGAQPVYVEVDN